LRGTMHHMTPICVGGRFSPDFEVFRHRKARGMGVLRLAELGLGQVLDNDSAGVRRARICVILYPMLVCQKGESTI
jgi:hypothetical protein